MTRELPAPARSESPTRVRYGVLGFACTLSMVTYLDRVCFQEAAADLIRELGLSGPGDLKWAFTAFAFAYAAFEVPSGWLGDVFGPKKVLIRIVLWWSFFTALTGLVGMSFGALAFGLGTLTVIRFLFGMGEAGAYPNITRALHNWLPLRERGVGQGAVWMAGRLMGGLTPLVWWLLVREWGVSWRGAFWIFGGLGVVWCIAFWLWFQNRPHEKIGVNEAEIALIQEGKHGQEEAGHAGVPWRKLFTSGNLWALCIMYACGAYGWYFNITYLSGYLEEQHGVKPGDWVGAVLKGGPLWLGAMACLVGGYLSDSFIRRTGNLKWGRRVFGVVGHSLCGLCYLGCLFAPDAFSFFLAISFAAFFNDLTMGPAWACCQDIGRKYAAIVAGFMNTVGNLGGTAASWITGTILQETLAARLAERAAALGVSVSDLTPSEVAAEKAAGHLPGYEINFVIFALVYAIAVLLWLRIDATQPVAPDDPAPSPA